MIAAAMSATGSTKRIPERIHSLALAAARPALRLVLVAAAAWFTRHSPPWMMMWVIATGQFSLLKLANLRGHWRGANGWRVAAFVLLWPGMNAARFLRDDPKRRPDVP